MEFFIFFYLENSPFRIQKNNYSYLQNLVDKDQQIEETDTVVTHLKI